MKQVKCSYSTRIRFPSSVAVVLIALISVSCAPTDRNALEKEVLEADPGFSEVLDKHKELSSRIQQYQHELSLKRSTLERNIESLRQELAEATAQVREKTVATRQLILPEQERMKLDLSVSKGELRAKQIQRSNLGRSISKLQKALDSEDSMLNEKDRTDNQAQLDRLSSEAAALDEKLTDLDKHIHLLKIKLLLIRL